MSDTKPTLYIAYASGPCRSIILMLQKFNALDKINIKEVNIMGGETRTPEFLAMNPFHSCPTLNHGELNLWESTAIIEYLVELLDLKGEWGLAADITEKYKQINMLHKYHNLIAPGQRQIMGPYYAALLTGAPFEPEAMKAGLEKTKADQYKMLEEILAKNGGFVAGNTPSAADIHYWIDLFQLTADGPYTLSVYDFAEHPNIKAWLQKVKDAVFDEKLYIESVKPMIDMVDAKLEGKFKFLKQ